MFFFVAYAVVVWWLAARWRRRWRGFIAVAAGVAGLVGVAYLHYQLSAWTNHKIYLQVLQILLYPYTVMVGALGVFLASLPRGAAKGACAGCGYDLSGLPADARVCPECSRRMAPQPVMIRQSTPRSSTRTGSPPTSAHLSSASLLGGISATSGTARAVAD